MNPLMRFINILGLMFSLALPIHGQGYFPLKVGNVWQLIDRYPPGMVHTFQIIGDTVMPNGHEYYRFTGPLTQSNCIRQEGPVVYSYWPPDSSEYAIFKFNATIGDTISVRPSTQEKIVLDNVDSIYWFGRTRPRWSFMELESVLFGDRTVIDSFGFYHVFVEGPTDLDFQGAIIDSVQYGTITTIESESNLPTTFTLYPNYPNPFNPRTTLRFDLSSLTEVTLEVYSVIGEPIIKIIDGTTLPAGSYSYDWYPEDISSGVYLYRLTTRDGSRIGKLEYVR